MRPLHALLEAPEGMRGEFAWVCGYSADAYAMDSLAERFTRLMAAQRAHEGRVWIGLLLDHGNPWIRASDCPGVAHLRMAGQPWGMLHAKLALASFRAPDGTWILRLVVGTGNWTRQTMDDSLDLGWTVEVETRDLDRASRETRAACRDLRAAADLIREVRSAADSRLIDQAPGPVAELNRQAMLGLEEKLARVSALAGKKRAPRFFDNRKRSLELGLLRHLRKLPPARLNTLAMGSGFYEGSCSGLPSVPAGLVSKLRAEGRLTQSAKIHLIAQPEACQGLAEALATEAWRRSRWQARPPYDPKAGAGTSRRLHAKFILGASWRSGSDRMGGAWLYLGSGNLTNPGMARKAGRKGNLEAGVFLRPDVPWSELPDRLPLRWDVDPLDPRDAQSGEGMLERPPQWVPPVAFLRAEVRASDVLLVAPQPVEMEVLGLDGGPCSRSADGWAWQGSVPIEVTVSAGGGQARLPVVDASGRVGGGPLSALAFDEAMPLLLAFPDPPEVDELEEDPEWDGAPQPPSAQPPGGLQAAAGQSPSAAVRRMTGLIEAVATLQCGVDESSWPSWAVRLEQTLMRVAEDRVVHDFRLLELDPLHVLSRPAFLPQHALEAGRHHSYLELLARVREAWGMSDAEPLIKDQS